MPFRKTYDNLEKALLHPQRVRRLKLWLDQPEIPAAWGPGLLRLPHLRHLHIQGVGGNYEMIKPDILPTEIGQLTRLRHLTILNICIHEPPPWLTNLQQLRSLMIRGTDITAFPPMVTQLPRLRTLRIENSRVMELKTSLLDLPKLRHLGLRDTWVTTADPALMPKRLREIAFSNPNRSLEGKELKRYLRGEVR